MHLSTNVLVATFLNAALLSACGGGMPAGSAERSGTSSLPTQFDRAAPLTEESVLHSFGGAPDGNRPYSGLLVGKNGEMYGTTEGGGTGVSSSGSDLGTVFEISASGAERVIYSFGRPSDGQTPQAGVIEDKTGNLYGDTECGGSESASKCSSGGGIVYRLAPAKSGYRESVLHEFSGYSDGRNPLGDLLLDAKGALYGTTLFGGDGCPQSTEGCGTVFKLTPSGSGYTETILYAFKGGKDGANPTDALIADRAGSLYGTTTNGGHENSKCGVVWLYSAGCGTIFKLTPAGSSYSETILYRFQGLVDGRDDGKYPRGSLLAGPNGVFYGLTVGGYGTVFELQPKGSSYYKKILYAFEGGTDGEDPDDNPGLYRDKSGALYGTTTQGGKAKWPMCHDGCGTVFKLTPAGSTYRKTILHVFDPGKDGAHPLGGVVANSKGELFGPTWSGGTGSCASASSTGCGTIFKVAP